jgi:hypothetical protein
MKRFTAELQLGPKGSTGFIEVPFDVRAEFGQARPPVRGTMNGAPFRTTVAVYGGRPLLGLRKELREAAKVTKSGDKVKVVLERDDAPREIEAPADLRRALSLRPAAKKGWTALSYTHQRERVQAIEDAKRPETRAKRIAAAVEAAEGRAAKSPKR